jgi:hypothetical protein
MFFHYLKVGVHNWEKNRLIIGETDYLSDRPFALFYLHTNSNAVFIDDVRMRSGNQILRL